MDQLDTDSTPLSSSTSPSFVYGTAEQTVPCRNKSPMGHLLSIQDFHIFFQCCHIPLLSWFQVMDKLAVFGNLPSAQLVAHVAQSLLTV